MARTCLRGFVFEHLEHLAPIMARMGYFEHLAALAPDMAKTHLRGLISSIWSTCHSYGQNGPQGAYFECLGILILDVTRMGLDMHVLS